MTILAYYSTSLVNSQVTEKRHLKYYISMAGPDLLCVSSSPNSQGILKRIEREATFSYQTLTLSEENAANVMYINGFLVHRHIDEIPVSHQIINEKIDMPRKVLSFAELGKYSSGLTSCCLLVRRTRYIRNL
jgi:dimethylargininase